MSVTEQHEALIGRIARRHGLPDGPIARPSTQGVENWVWVVGESEERYVLRVPRTGASTAEFEREAWCSRTAIASGIPAPDILHVGSIDDTPYSVQTWVAGETGNAIRSHSFWKTLGSYTRTLASVSLDQAPDGLFSRFGRDPKLAWHRHVQYNLDELTETDPLIELGVYPVGLLDRIRTLFQEIDELDLAFGLVHGDLAVRNVILEPGGTRRLVLIDWGCATIGPVPHLEVLSLLRNRDERTEVTDPEINAFVEGFGADITAVMVQVEKLRILQAFDLTRWAVDKSPEQVQEKVEAARRLVQTQFSTSR